MSGSCETLPVTLSGTVRLAAFTTLNDRGKPLTNLEKVKSLFMEIDDNSPTPNPVAINNGFGRLYQSIEAQNSYIHDDEFLRQVAMTLWEGGDLTQINGVNWPRFEPGKPRSNYIHQIGMDTLYEEYFKKIPTGIAASFLHGDIVPAIDKITDDHNALSAITGQSKTGTALNAPSFVNSLGCVCAARDAIEDYFSVLISLGLQARQIGFLFEVRRLFPCHQWHDVLGSCQFDNQALKNQLHDQLAQIERDPASQDEKVADFIKATKEEISAITDLASRDYTALQLAEALRLIVGNSKPGGFSGTWFSTFRANTSITVQDFTSRWCSFIASHNSRFNFIMNVAQNPAAYNNSLWTQY